MRKNARQDAINRLREQQEPRRMVGRQIYRGNERLGSVPFNDDWERDFDRTVKRAGKGFALVWLIMMLLSLAATGVVIWAVIELVLWLTSK